MILYPIQVCLSMIEWSFNFSVFFLSPSEWNPHYKLCSIWLLLVSLISLAMTSFLLTIVLFFLSYDKLMPTSGPLHWLFLLPEKSLLCRACSFFSKDKSTEEPSLTTFLKINIPPLFSSPTMPTYNCEFFLNLLVFVRIPFLWNQYQGIHIPLIEIIL